MSETPYGLCGCGCGAPTWIATITSRKRGWVKGQPVKYRRGHGSYGIRTVGIEPPNPSGLCLCGCGTRTNLSAVTSRVTGDVRGEPLRFRLGHARRVTSASPNPSGLCQCGCGQVTSIATIGNRRVGHVAGEHIRFVHGHHSRGDGSARWTGDELSSNAAHTWLLYNYPKTGVCEECGKKGKTHHAFQHHPARHTRNRADYRELCPLCHRRFDAQWRKPPRASAQPPQSKRTRTPRS